MRMRSKCTNSTSGRKSLTGNEYSDTDIKYDSIIANKDMSYDVESLIILFWRFFGGTITTSNFNSDVIFEFSAPVFP